MVEAPVADSAKPVGAPSLKPRCYGKRSAALDKCESCVDLVECSRITISIATAKKPVHIVGP